MTLKESRTSVVFLKQYIFEDQIQKPHEIAWLSNHDIIVKTNSNKVFIITTIEGQKKAIEVHFDFEIKESTSFLAGEDSSVYIYSDFYYLFDTEEYKNNPKYCLSQKQYFGGETKQSKPFLKLFRDSGALIELSSYQGGVISPFKENFLDLGNYQSLLDNTNLVLQNLIKDDDKTVLELMNVSTWTRQSMIIERQYFSGDIIPGKVMKLNENTLIVCEINSQSKLMVHTINTAQRRTKLVLQLEQIQGCTLEEICKTRQCLLISIKRINERKEKLLLFNYKNNQILWEIVKPETTNLCQMFKQDHTEYIDIQKNRRGENNRLVLYSHPKVKKVYFHLFKKSRLESAFGEGMMRSLLKVLE